MSEDYFSQEFRDSIQKIREQDKQREARYIPFLRQMWQTIGCMVGVVVGTNVIGIAGGLLLTVLWGPPDHAIGPLVQLLLIPIAVIFGGVPGAIIGVFIARRITKQRNR